MVILRLFTNTILLIACVRFFFSEEVREACYKFVDAVLDFTWR